MKKPAAIRLSIPEPCTQAWEGMQPVTGGRHCASCEKVVTDFSRMTDAQLLDYFRKLHGEICETIKTEQLDKIFREIIVPKSMWLARIVIGILLFFGLSKSANGQSKIENRTTEHHSQELNNKRRQGSASFHGRYIDSNNIGIANTKVTITMGGIYIGETLTDSLGNYMIGNINGGVYSIKFSHAGKDVTYTLVPIAESQSRQFNGRSDYVPEIYTPPAIPIINPEMPGKIPGK